MTSSTSPGPLVGSVTVELLDLRQALAATLPHTDRSKEAPPLRANLHVRIDTGTGLASVIATNGQVSALSLVSVLDSALIEDGYELELSQETARGWLSFFPSRDLTPDNQLQIDVHEQCLIATDTSGLLVGKQGRWPLDVALTDDVDLLDGIRGVLERVEHRQPPVDGALRHWDWHAQGKILAAFKSAAEAYGCPLRIQPTGGLGPVLVSAGDSFLAAMVQPVLSDRERADEREARRGWLARFGLDTQPANAGDPEPTLDVS